MVRFPLTFLAVLPVLLLERKCQFVDFRYPEFVPPQFVHPEFVPPEFVHPEFVHPEFIHPKFVHPKFVYPEFQYSEFSHPEFQHPKFQHPQFQHPNYQHPEYQRPVNDPSTQEDEEAKEYPNIQILSDIFKIQTHQPLRLALPTIVPDEDILFLLFTRNNPTSPIELTNNNLHILDPRKITKYIVHGWITNSSISWYRRCREAYLKKSDYQIILVDWGKYSKVGYPEAVENAKSTGGVIARHIFKTRLPLHTIHLIGHSLGAQASGFAGKMIKQLTFGRRVRRISGLDPAGPLFEGTDFDDHLNSNDATFVDCIHTDITVNYAEADCSVDFYPNGGKFQPGCPFIPIGDVGDVSEVVMPVLFCSHSRAHTYFIESINSEDFVAIRCDSYWNFITKACSENQKVVMGENVPETTRFIYYLKTNRKTPYAIG